MRMVDVEIKDGVSRIRLNGELTIYSAVELRDQLLGSIGAARGVELDLSEVSELDSAGVQVLCAFRSLLLASERDLHVVGMNDGIRRIFNLMGLESRFIDDSATAGIYGEHLHGRAAIQ